MMKTNHLLSLIALVMLVLTGCKSKQEFLYLADMKADDTGYIVANRHNTRIQDDDRLKITVSCKNPELAAPFNVSSAAVKVTTSGTVSTPTGDNVYRVNREGDITFPILGVLHVAGMSLIEASDMIRDLIIEGNYIKDPIVTIEFKNFHYTVLGAVGGNGTYSVDGDKVTILEAIAKAGDLSANADLERIAVIRESDGKRKLYELDIRSTDIFNSPAFYLAQNDIIYARPKTKKADGTEKTFRWITLALSFISATATIMWATRSFK